MELKVKEVTMPEAIEFNFDELKAEITSKVEMYKSLVYGEDEIKAAKKDKAALNKFVKALSDERIRVKKKCLQPYEDFEAKVKTLSRIVEEPIAIIDKQIKGYEEKCKAEKRDAIEALWAEVEHPVWLNLDKFFSDKWLNASTSLGAIKEEMRDSVGTIASHINTLENLPEFGFEAVEVYKTTLDINRAINEAKTMSEIAKKKAEASKVEDEASKRAAEELARVDAECEALKAEAQQAINEAEASEPKKWIAFEAELTIEQARSLGAYFKSNNINFRPL